jgi:hypothetical protein
MPYAIKKTGLVAGVPRHAKETLSVLLGVSPGDLSMVRAILTVSTMANIIPISMQRVSDFTSFVYGELT